MPYTPTDGRLATAAAARQVLEEHLPAYYLVVDRPPQEILVLNRRTGAVYHAVWADTVGAADLVECVARWRQKGEPSSEDVARHILVETEPRCRRA